MYDKLKNAGRIICPLMSKIGHGPLMKMLCSVKNSANSDLNGSASHLSLKSAVMYTWKIDGDCCKGQKCALFANSRNCCCKRRPVSMGFLLLEGVKIRLSLDLPPSKMWRRHNRWAISIWTQTLWAPILSLGSLSRSWTYLFPILPPFKALKATRNLNLEICYSCVVVSSTMW